MSDDQLITDLAAQMVQKPAATGLGLASATIKSWDPNTLSGELDYQGEVLRDIPVLSGTDALTWRAGDEVILDTWYPPDGHRRRGFGSFMIRGRVVRPGAANAERIIQFLQSELAKQIVDEIVQELLVSPAGQELAAFVFAQRIHHNVGTSVSVTEFGTSFGDPTSGGPRPVVADVPIVSGTALVFLAADWNNLGYSSVNGVGSMDFGVAVSGATSVSADSNDYAAFGRRASSGSGQSDIDGGRFGRTVVIDELNEGTHTFTGQYRHSAAVTAGTLAAPTMIVIGL